MTSATGWVPVDAGPHWLEDHEPMSYPSNIVMRCFPCYERERASLADGHVGDTAPQGEKEPPWSLSFSRK